MKEDVGTFKKSPPPKKDDVDKKFGDWEIDEEIAQMKAEMNSPGFKDSQKNQKVKNNKPETNKDKINRAYNILGLKPDASSEQIKQAYKKLVKKWHPDLFVNQPQELTKAKEKIRSINEAYGILSSE